MSTCVVVEDELLCRKVPGWPSEQCAVRGQRGWPAGPLGLGTPGRLGLAGSVVAGSGARPIGLTAAHICARVSQPHSLHLHDGSPSSTMANNAAVSLLPYPHEIRTPTNRRRPLRRFASDLPPIS